MNKFFITLLATATLLISTEIGAQGVRGIAVSAQEYLASKETGSVIKPYVTELPEEFLNMKYSAHDSNEQSLPPTNYIIGGNNASRNEYREYVLVLILNSFGTEFIGSCGGTLIGSNKVLTAAHCLVFSANRYVVIPEFYSFQDSLVASDFFEATAVRQHPSYSSSTSEFDVGVITLERGSSSPRAPVFSGGSDLVDENGTVIGNGLISTQPTQFADILQEVSAPIIDNDRCNSIWSGLTGGSRPIRNSMLCAGFRSDGRGSCSGDSGSPLFVNIQGRRTVVGSVSFGLPTCEDNRANQVYARMSEVVSFIQSQSPSTSFVSFSDANTQSSSGLITPIIGILLDDSD